MVVQSGQKHNEKFDLSLSFFFIQMTDLGEAELGYNACVLSRHSWPEPDYNTHIWEAWPSKHGSNTAMFSAGRLDDGMNLLFISKYSIPK